MKTRPSSEGVNKRRNALKNLTYHHCGLGEIVVMSVREQSISKHYKSNNTHTHTHSNPNMMTLHNLPASNTLTADKDLKREK